jgi:hypothetical protein
MIHRVDGAHNTHTHAHTRTHTHTHTHTRARAFSCNSQEEFRHEFSPAAIRTLYEKDGTRCGPPLASSGQLAQTSTIGNMNKTVEGLTRMMRAGQATGSRMRASSALAIVSTTEKEKEGAEKVRSCNLYLYEGGDPGGKSEYTQRFNHDDARAPLLLTGTNLPSVNMEVCCAPPPPPPPPPHTHTRTRCGRRRRSRARTYTYTHTHTHTHTAQHNTQHTAHIHSLAFFGS